MPGCKRCSLHAINYPSNFNRCLVANCDEELAYFSNQEPDDDYKDQVAYFAHLGFDNEAHNFMDTGFETQPDDVPQYPRIIDPELSLMGFGELVIPTVNKKPHEYADQLWVSHEDLIKAGYLYLEDFQIVMLQGRFYELGAHVGRASLTHGIRGGVWWIEEVRPDAFVFPDCVPEGW